MMNLKTRSQLVKDKAPLLTNLDAQAVQSTNLSSEKHGAEHNLGEQQKIEKALKASEVRYRRLFETAKDGILLLDADTGQITDVNPFLQNLLGYSHIELLGRTLWEIGPFKDIAASQNAFRLLQSQEYVRYENLPLETKDGQHRQVEFVSNVYLEDGRRVIQCNIRDITERKQSEAEVQKANGKLVALVAELKKRDQDMLLLNRMNDLLQVCTTQVEAYQVINVIAGDLFIDQTGCLAIYHPQDQHFEVVVHWGREGQVETIFSWNDCWAMRRGHLHEVMDTQTGLLCHHFIHPPESGYLCVPLLVHGEILGILCLLGGDRKDGHFADQQLAVAIGEGIKLALFNIELREELREQAVRDPLTGLYNRRFMEENLERELSRAQRQNSPLCVSLLDIKHFKGINDTYGHAAGDKLLAELGRILQENMRKSDIACRYGGDEFVLILPDSTLDDASHRVQQILELVKESRVWHDDQQIESPIITAGVAEANKHNFNSREIMRAADEALYAVKKAERELV